MIDTNSNAVQILKHAVLSYEFWYCAYKLNENKLKVQFEMLCNSNLKWKQLKIYVNISILEVLDPTLIHSNTFI